MENSTINTEILVDLIQINNDRVTVYTKALSELRENDSNLRSLFPEMIRQNYKHRSTLTQEVQVLGANAETGSHLPGNSQQRLFCGDSTFNPNRYIIA